MRAPESSSQDGDTFQIYEPHNALTGLAMEMAACYKCEGDVVGSDKNGKCYIDEHSQASIAAIGIGTFFFHASGGCASVLLAVLRGLKKVD